MSNVIEILNEDIGISIGGVSIGGSSINGVSISILGLATILVVIYGFAIISLIAIRRFNVAIRASSEKIKRDAIARFNIKERGLLDQIEEEPDKKERKKLKQKVFHLRREYESRMSDNLQRKDGKFTANWSEVLLAARKRLLDEEQRLQIRNVINLVTGIFSVLAGIILLIVFLLLNDKAKANGNFIDFLTIYWARIGVVITIGVFSGFFLRLYSLTERAIEKNKNEITNIELRLTSGLLLSKKTSVEKFDSLADDLAKEERNFVLKKNETSATADIDKVDIDRIVEIATKIIKATK